MEREARNEMVLWRYTALPAWKKKLIEQRMMWFTPPKYLNDPNEFCWEVRNDGVGGNVPRSFVQQSFNDQTHVMSLTVDPLSPTMWSAYGGDLSGVCIGFKYRDCQRIIHNGIEYQRAEGPFGTAFEVRYLPDWPKQLTSSALTVDFGRTKHVEWESEKEWRVFWMGTYKFGEIANGERTPIVFRRETWQEPESSTNSSVVCEFQPGDVCAVYRGPKMSDVDKTWCWQLCNQWKAKCYDVVQDVTGKRVWTFKETPSS